MATRKMLVDLDINLNSLNNAVLQQLSADPVTTKKWQVFYDTDDDRIKLNVWTAWTPSFKKIMTEDDAGSASFSGLTDTNIVTPSAWQVSIYDGTDSWDNKTLSWDITMNSSWVMTIGSERIDFGMLNTADMTTDLWASATTTQIARADAIKSYVDSAVATADAVVLKGDIDCSTNPNYPAADAWHSYIVSVSWKIGWASWVAVNVWDMITCKTDSSAAWDQATVWVNWFILETNRDTATEVTLGLVQLATTAEANTWTDTSKAVTSAWVKANYDGRWKTWTLWDWAATSIVITHWLSNQFVNVQAYEESGWALVECEIVLTDANTVTFNFNEAPATNTIRYVIR